VVVEVLHLLVEAVVQHQQGVTVQTLLVELVEQEHHQVLQEVLLLVQAVAEVAESLLVAAVEAVQETQFIKGTGNQHLLTLVLVVVVRRRPIRVVTQAEMVVLVL
jgi:hypothetical protein